MNISEKKERLFLVINGVLIVFFIMLYLFLGDMLFSEEQYFEAYLLQSIFLITSLAVAGFFCLILTKMYKLSTSTGKVWLNIGIGMLLWMVGEIIYTYYELFTDEAPFPSIADFFYLIAYLPLALGLLIQTKLLGIKLSKTESIMILVIFVIVSILVLWFTLFYPIQLWYEGAPIPEDEIFSVVVGALYPIFDLVLLICVMVVFMKFRHGEINLAWIILLIGILLTIVADIIFNYVANVIDKYVTWEMFDLIFLISYMFIYLSAFMVISLMSRTFEEP